MKLDYFPLLEHGPQGDAVIKTSGFGPRWGRTHNGVDYGTVLGQLNGAPIHAPFDGWVTRGHEPYGAGNWVWVQGANGWLFKAFHLSGYTGPNNAHVDAGTAIGYVGTTGASSGPHLHAELWHYGQVQNPEPYFDEAFNAGRFPGSHPEEDMPLTDDDAALVAGKVLYALSGRAKAEGQAWAQADTNLGDVINAVMAYRGGGSVDTAALAASLRSSLGDAIADELADRLKG